MNTRVTRADTCEWTNEVFNEIRGCTSLLQFYLRLYHHIQDLRTGKVPVEKLVSSVHYLGDIYQTKTFYVKVFVERLINKGVQISSGEWVKCVYARDTRQPDTGKTGDQMFMPDEITSHHEILYGRYVKELGDLLHYAVFRGISIMNISTDIRHIYTFKTPYSTLNLFRPGNWISLFVDDDHSDVLKRLLYYLCETLYDFSLVRIVLSKVNTSALPVPLMGL